MRIIKGPLKFKGFKGSKFMSEKIMEAASNSRVKLPFQATGFSSTQFPKQVSTEGIEFASGFDPKNPKLIGAKIKPVAKPVAVPKAEPIVAEPEPKKKVKKSKSKKK